MLIRFSISYPPFCFKFTTEKFFPPIPNDYPLSLDNCLIPLIMEENAAGRRCRGTGRKGMVLHYEKNISCQARGRRHMHHFFGGSVSVHADLFLDSDRICPLSAPVFPGRHCHCPGSPLCLSKGAGAHKEEVTPPSSVSHAVRDGCGSQERARR